MYYHHTPPLRTYYIVLQFPNDVVSALAPHHGIRDFKVSGGESHVHVARLIRGVPTLFHPPTTENTTALGR